MRSCVDLAALDPQDKARVLPYIRDWADSAMGMTATQVFVAAAQSHVARVTSVNACRGFDYILSPTSPVHAAAAEDPSPTTDPLHGLEHIGFTVPYNMSEQPAASINCGYSRSGMPIGLQIAGQRFDDLGVMQVSRAFELLRGPQHAWPEPPPANA
jgi:aspartyl-tRNA(Asn)/glutamyl-tRNA(Gln) amidotransferase subunit A